MSRLHKILLGVFCGGVLLCGIGTGIAFAEFSSLAYGGEHILGGSEMETKELDVEFEPENGPCWIGAYLDGSNVSEAELDESVPENTVRFQVTYNAKRVKPYAYYDKSERSVTMYGQWFRNDELELLMEAKDLALQDLKEHKISSYDTRGIEEVTILINPANENDITFHF